VLSGTTPQFYTDNYTLTDGAIVVGGYVGYEGYGSGFGSLSPAGSLTGGMTLGSFDDITGGSGSTGEVSVTGFSSDPGQGWLWSATALGVTRLGSSATTYQYSSGTATWIFPGWGFNNMTVGTTTAATVVHK